MQTHPHPHACSLFFSNLFSPIFACNYFTVSPKTFLVISDTFLEDQGDVSKQQQAQLRGASLRQRKSHKMCTCCAGIKGCSGKSDLPLHPLPFTVFYFYPRQQQLEIYKPCNDTDEMFLVVFFFFPDWPDESSVDVEAHHNSNYILHQMAVLG